MYETVPTTPSDLKSVADDSPGLKLNTWPVLSLVKVLSFVRSDCLGPESCISL